MGFFFRWRFLARRVARVVSGHGDSTIKPMGTPRRGTLIPHLRAGPLVGIFGSVFSAPDGRGAGAPVRATAHRH